ncbi:MAG: helix-turn-helix domain-containing protein [Bacteroidales bacterium]|nr:helix-turn-helix domain-containing protein [Bacteroidales bacterium]
MKDRIKKIIDYENISSTKFADIVGIERSGVSHLINGRNNPSLDVIQKICEAFEYINTDWLLLGKGSMIKDNKKEIQGNLFSDIDDNQDDNYKEDKLLKDHAISGQNLNNLSVETKTLHSPTLKKQDKQIVKIVIFWSDKTFSDYIPEN